MSVTNAERYKTAEERHKAHFAWCKANKSKAKCDEYMPCIKCAFRWLELEARNEDLMPCPFCGGDTEVVIDECGCYCVSCIHCEYGSPAYNEKEYAVAAHNSVRKAVEAYKES